MQLPSGVALAVAQALAAAPIRPLAWELCMPQVWPQKEKKKSYKRTSKIESDSRDFENKFMVTKGEMG